MEYIAHKDENGRVQLLSEHLTNTAEICRENAVDEFKACAELCGLLHDLGKYSSDFQNRINGSQMRVEHARCGAQELKTLLKAPNMFIPMMQYCIAGHHSGIPDGGVKTDESDKPTLCGILKREEKDISSYKKEISFGPLEDTLLPVFSKCMNNGDELIETYAFFTRYLYSCLVDGDFIDTERFFDPQVSRSLDGDFEKAYELVCKKIDSFKAETPLQKARGALQSQVYKNMEKEGDIYTINMPTGSGKTLCSIRAALKKLLDENKKRIIYVIPYTSIIEQTAAVFEEIFGEALPVLQHHSNFDFGDEAENENADDIQKLKRTCENWDAPLVITTNVQFFESIYHNKGSRLRKMHNLADSVIVFDEIHMLPLDYIQPAFRSMGYLTKYLNSTVILMSATMPDYRTLMEKYMPDCKIVDAVEDRELFDKFEKCRYEYIGQSSLENIAERAAAFDSALIIVNKRKTAQELYGICSEIAQGDVYHLSTYMTPEHRTKVIAKIKASLNSGKKTYVVSTSLVEAGVDFDFETVFRENAGADNIIQSGGRCNREGKRKLGMVYVFEYSSVHREIRMKANISRSLFNEFGNIASEDCVKEYYRRIIWENKAEIENNSIARLMGKSLRFESIPFKTYAESFKFIDNLTVGLVIPNDENEKYIDALRNGGMYAKRKLQRYCASIYFYELEDLIKSGLAKELDGGVYVLTNSDYYNQILGLKTDSNIDYIL